MIIKFRKEKISIQNIGKERFWIGILLGLISAIIIALTFNYFRELSRFFTSLSYQLIKLNEFEAQFYNYFFSALSTFLGLYITLSIWMTNKKHYRKKDKMYKQLAITNNLLFLVLFIWLFARLGTIFTFILYTRSNYNNHLNLLEDFWFLFLLIPIFIFIHSWSIIRQIYMTTKWILISLLVCILTSLIIKTTTSIDYKILNSKKSMKLDIISSTFTEK